MGYLLAGDNHFVHPSFYIPIIPLYISFSKLMNVLMDSIGSRSLTLPSPLERI